MKRSLLYAAAALAIGLVGCKNNDTASADWSAYNAHSTNDHFSNLAEITTRNVSDLKEAWRINWPESGDPQTNPLIVDGIVYAYTPTLKVVAINGATGKLLWTFDAGLRGNALGPGMRFTGPARGLTFWRQGRERRLIAGIMQYLFELDPDTGRVITSFGKDGAIDLRAGLRGDTEQHYVSLTTPGVVYQDMVIVGFRASENLPAPPGDIRAYDIRTGNLRWQFHTIPKADEFGADSWPQNARDKAGGANSWPGMALDAERGIVFVPTGSAVPDFYGGVRLGDNLFANTLLALDARTGKRLWHFQSVHHDIWDRDFPSPPVLLSVNREGKSVPAVAQTSKQGYVYLFNRVDGSPLFPIREVPYPASQVPGERASPTQPKPDLPAPFARQNLTESDLTDRTPAARAWALEQFRTFRNDGLFTPLAIGTPTVVFPGFDGGAEWGGSAVDPARGILYVNSNDVAWTGSLLATVKGGGLGSALYQQHCASCHGSERKGSPPAIPALDKLAGRLNESQIASVVRSGRGRMPPFTNIQSLSLVRLTRFLLTGEDQAAPMAREATVNGRSDMVAFLGDDFAPAPYRFAGYVKFLDPEGYPAVKPPWGTLNAIDMNSGQYLWKVPLGSYPELNALGLKQTGSENYGGPILTAGGVLFIGASIYDHKLHAYDAASGKLLWEGSLPASGTATPATYRANGKQYVIIATSNARTPSVAPSGGYVAFALP